VVLIIAVGSIVGCWIGWGMLEAGTIRAIVERIIITPIEIAITRCHLRFIAPSYQELHLVAIGSMRLKYCHHYLLNP
jgi:hypothetical protein